MKLSTLFIYNSVITLPFGAILIIIPEYILNLFGGYHET